MAMQTGVQNYPRLSVILLFVLFFLFRVRSRSVSVSRVNGVKILMVVFTKCTNYNYILFCHKNNSGKNVSQATNNTYTNSEHIMTLVL